MAERRLGLGQGDLEEWLVPRESRGFACNAVDQQVELRLFPPAARHQPVDLSLDGVVGRDRDPDTAARGHQLGRFLNGLGSVVAGWRASNAAPGAIDRRTSLADLARLLKAVTLGSLLNWAIHRNGTAVPWLTRDLDLVLNGYSTSRVSSPPRAVTSRGKPRSR